MTSIRRRLRKFAWLALLAICGLAFGPTISRGLGVAIPGHDALHAGGLHSEMHAHDAGMAMGHGDEPAPARTAPAHSFHLLDCCALCAVAATPFTAVFIATPDFTLPASSPPLLPGDVYAAARPAEPWSTPAPRGPPARA